MIFKSILKILNYSTRQKGESRENIHLFFVNVCIQVFDLLELRINSPLYTDKKWIYTANFEHSFPYAYLCM